MALFKLQGYTEKQRNIYYEFDSEDIPLGEGGMGKVYKGRCVEENSGHSRIVAVKFLNEKSSLNPYVVEKARREASMKFKHENLVEMLGFIETETKSKYDHAPIHHYHVVSELLVGVSLDDLLKGKLTDQQGNYMPYAEKLFKEYQQDSVRFAIGIVKSVLSGLMFMHDAGYIHRDIDPSNIMITTDGRVKLIDYGIAKKVSALTTNDKHLTNAGEFIGKPEYASPEQILGEINLQNQSTDIYSVGILLFQCITGHPPFEGDRVDIIQKQLHKPLPLKQIKDKALRGLIKHATEKLKSKRIQNAAEFRYELEKLKPTEHISSYSTWKLATFGVVTPIMVVCSFWLIIHFWPEETPIPTVKTELTYNDAVDMISKSDKVAEGFSALKELSDDGNDSATFLLSRLYFKSNERYGKDSLEIQHNKIKHLQDIVEQHIEDFKIDNIYAHSLLEKSKSQNEQNYMVLYELGYDYWKADDRTDAVTNRDGEKAESLLNDALELAKKAGDTKYVKVIETILSHMEEWRENCIALRQEESE